MEILHTLLDWVLHLDKHLAEIISQYGALTYAILFFVIFAETGFVVTPFLPGDSLLFAAGAIAANEHAALNVHLLALLLVIAAVSGNQLNYAIGRWVGPAIVEKPNRFIKKQHLERTHKFYEKHGGKTIVFSRFAPIIRTFAPFVAGIGKMNASQFTFYNIIGGVSWIALFIYAGFFFGNRPAVKENIGLVVVAIVVVSLLPAVFEYIRMRRARNSQV